MPLRIFNLGSIPRLFRPSRTSQLRSPLGLLGALPCLRGQAKGKKKTCLPSIHHLPPVQPYPDAGQKVPAILCMLNITRIDSCRRQERFSGCVDSSSQIIYHSFDLTDDRNFELRRRSTRRCSLGVFQNQDGQRRHPRLQLQEPA